MTTYIVSTATGTSHYVSEEALRYRRIPQVSTPTDTTLEQLAMRRDGEELRLLEVPELPVVGEPMTLKLEPLGEGEATLRITSPVVGVNFL